MTEESGTRMADAKGMPKVGEIIDGRYRVDSVLGEGGFAVVYRCYDERTHTDVAVKVLDPMMSSRADFSARFLREIKTVSSLRHHHTIKIFDANKFTAEGSDITCLYLVMELLKGSDLEGIIEKGGPMDPARVQRITIQVLKSLHEAHDKGIVHRDLKPANVFIADIPGETDYVKVLDFGIAKSQEEGQNSNLTATGQIMCSPDYVAPERVVDSLTFPSSDLYSLGIMMIEMLDAKLPYRGETPIAVALQHARKEEPVPLSTQVAEGPLGHIVRKAVAKNYELRYQSAEEMLEDLIAVRFDGAAPFLTEMHAPVGRGAATVVSPAIARNLTEALPSADDLEIESSGLSGKTIALIAVALALVIGAGATIFALNAKRPAEPLALDTLEPADVPQLDPIEPEPEDTTAALEEDAAAAVEDELADSVLPPDFPETITLQTMPSGAELFLKGEPLGVAPYTLRTSWITEFPFELEARLSGHETTVVSIESPDALLNLRSIRLDEIVRRSSSRHTSDSTTSSSSSTGGSAAPANTTPPADSTREAAASDTSDSDGGGRGRIGAVRVRQ